MEQKFSANEDAIKNLIGMREFVNGLAGSSSNINKQAEEKIEAELGEILVDDYIVNLNESCKATSEILKSPVKLTAQVFPADVLAEEICIKKEFQKR